MGRKIPGNKWNQDYFKVGGTMPRDPDETSASKQDYARERHELEVEAVGHEQPPPPPSGGEDAGFRGLDVVEQAAEAAPVGASDGAGDEPAEQKTGRRARRPKVTAVPADRLDDLAEEVAKAVDEAAYAREDATASPPPEDDALLGADASMRDANVAAAPVTEPSAPPPRDAAVPSSNASEEGPRVAAATSATEPSAPPREALPDQADAATRVPASHMPSAKAGTTWPLAIAAAAIAVPFNLARRGLGGAARVRRILEHRFDRLQERGRRVWTEWTGHARRSDKG